MSKCLVFVCCLALALPAPLVHGTPPPPPQQKATATPVVVAEGGEGTCCRFMLEDASIVASDKKKNFILIVAKRLNEQIAQYDVRVDQLEVKEHLSGIGEAKENEMPVASAWFWPEPEIPTSWSVLLDKGQFDVNEVQVVSTLEHEFAHVLYAGSSEYRKLAGTYFGEMSSDECNEFKDDRFVHDGTGHPADNPGELFASAFSAVSMAKEGFIKNEDLTFTGHAAEFYEKVCALKLFKVRANPYPAWGDASTRPRFVFSLRGHSMLQLP